MEFSRMRNQIWISEFFLPAKVGELTHGPSVFSVYEAKIYFLSLGPRRQDEKEISSEIKQQLSKIPLA